MSQPPDSCPHPQAPPALPATESPPSLRQPSATASPSASHSPPADRSQTIISTQHYGAPPTLLQLSNIQATLHLQKQLNTANATISKMQEQIQVLTKQLSDTSLLTNENTDNVNNTEVRIKNLLKTNKQELSQQIQDTRENHKKLQAQVKDTVSKLQSFQDSQTNTNTVIKKQVQTLNTAKEMPASSNSTHHKISTSPSRDVAQNEHSDPTKQEYTIATTNKFAALSESCDQQTPASVTETKHTKKNKMPNNNPNSSIYNDSQDQTENKPNTPLPSPLATLMKTSIPLPCDTLLLGDSTLKGVDERRLSTDDNTVKKLSVPGLTVQQLCQWLTSRRPSPYIRRVTVHVGLNSCSEGPVSVADWTKLIHLLRRVFPRAALQASSIVPPVGQHPLKDPASRSTANLRRSCLQEGVVYIDNTPSFLARSGAPRRAMYHDRIHPSALGYKALALNIRFSANNRPHYQSVYPRPSARPYSSRQIPNHQTQLNNNTLTKRNGPVTTSVPMSSHSPQAVDYNNDFPLNTFRNPNSQIVFNALGRHHTMPKQPLLTPPPYPYPDNSPSCDRIEERRGTGWSDRNPTIPQNHGHGQPPTPLSPAAAQPPSPRKDGHQLHPYAVQFFNSMAAHFMSQQRQASLYPVI